MGNFDEYLMWQQIAFMKKHSRYGMLPLQSIKTMGDENMEQRKFKPGDKIRVVDYTPNINGKTGEIKYFDGSSWRPYQVQVYGESELLWLDSDEIELVEEKKMTGNKAIDALMEELGVEVGEEFIIKGDYEEYSPHHFNAKGELKDRNDCSSNSELMDLIYGKLEIKKIPKKEVKEMTIGEIQELLKEKYGIDFDVKVVKEEK